jgi:hypothetical protein
MGGREMVQVQQPGPYDNVGVGTMLFTLVEPHAGHEVAYNRWYERDHFYAGCLVGKSWFAGKRWVATRSLKDLRFPRDDSFTFLPDIDQGSYLATYWVEKGQDAEAIAWGSEQVKWLHENGRMFDERDHIHTLMYVVRWAVERDHDSVPVALALDHPWHGLVAVMVDRDEGVDARSFSNAVRDEILPTVLPGSPLALVVAATPIPLPEGAPVFQPENPGVERRTVLLCFLDDGPAGAMGTVHDLAHAIEQTGQGRVSYAAPFLPTIPGTDTHTDQLW